VKLEEAIEFNNALRKDLVVKGLLTFAKALQLGIEALKQVKESRFDPSSWEPRLLPGETKE